MSERVVIVGGGVAGVSTAGALRAGGFDGDLTLVDAGEFPYDRPPLSKDFLAGTQDIKQIALKPQQWYDDQRVRLMNRTTVSALRPADGAVELVDGALLPADRVVLATGGGAARPPIPGAHSDRVHVLRTAKDADRLREALGSGARVLVVGAGLIGAEAASTAVRLGCEVVLADPVAVPLAAAIGAELADWLHGLHHRAGITTLHTGVDGFTDRPGGIEARFTDAGEPAAEPQVFDAVLLGVGMVPRTEIAQSAGLRVEGGIVVDERQLTSHPAVLAVGDPARTRRDGVLLPRTEHWEAAQHDGARAAATLLGTTPPPATAPWFWTDRHDRHVEAVGHMASAELTVVRGSYDDPAFAVFGLRDGHVVAAASVDDPMAVRAARRMIDRQVAVRAGPLADPSVNLRSLLRG
ncbi:NAD(P)/FAD-dependent oxidoreductase [Streptomyces gilvus]|uniref:NAD(P)/FAD-dependent oxidoreductase n=1 Tax=Streptomyces gilvus TaxID=2920937 RepID=UPI001F116F53|nr:FAD-dependent oxidoreductase [Streptomyces sp. CME 23]MCH5672875.1 FAD-dependent oxidoreductase [Streptomyces sp. CME 23]